MHSPAPEPQLSPLVARCWADPAFKARLLADPAAVLQAEGLPLPAGMRLEVVEDTPQRVHWVLPARPTDLSDDALEQVAGGSPYLHLPHEQAALTDALLNASNLGAFFTALVGATKPEFLGKVLEVFGPLSKKYR